MKKRAPESGTLTIRLEKSEKIKLERLAEATDRSKSYLASEAIHNYIELQAWQIEGIKHALKQADEGKFADPADVKAIFKKYRIK